MIERIVEQKEPIRVILGNDRKTAHLMLSWQDTDILDSIVAVLHPLHPTCSRKKGNCFSSIASTKSYNQECLSEKGW